MAINEYTLNGYGVPYTITDALPQYTTTFTAAAYSALISGATGNLGRACMTYAQRQGWQALGLARSTGDDLTDWDKTDSLFWHSRNTYDLIVVAHGTHRVRDIANTTQEDWEYVLRNSLDSVASLTTAILKYGRLRQGGLIVYCSSIQAQHTRAGRSAYAAARAGIEGYTRGVSAELRDYARAVCLRMGQFDVQMRDVKLSAEEKAKMQDRCYAPWLKPSDVARLIWQLYEQPGLTGSCIDLDSGQGLDVW